MENVKKKMWSGVRIIYQYDEEQEEDGVIQENE